jgi:hypothetical protein
MFDQYRHRPFNGMAKELGNVSAGKRDRGDRGRRFEGQRNG